MNAALLWMTLAAAAGAGPWNRLPPLPVAEGVAGAVAGTSGDALIVAGGANFPEKKPWEGGRKVWHDAVFVLETTGGSWRKAGTLPRPLAYAVCASWRDSLVCVGGSDAVRHYADSFRLTWKDERLLRQQLPSLPRPVANACGAIVGDTFYVAGGTDRSDATAALRSVYRLDLSSSSPRWEEIEALPGSGRMLAMAAVGEGSFWLIGGVELVPGKAEPPVRRYLRDAYRYTPGTGWKRIADLPYALAAAPSPAPVAHGGIYLLGGDDGTQVGTFPPQHRGFRGDVLRYDLKTAAWTRSANIAYRSAKDATFAGRKATLPAACATAPCVAWDGAWVIASGETHPGLRSPEVWRFEPRNKD